MKCSRESTTHHFEVPANIFSVTPVHFLLRIAENVSLPPQVLEELAGHKDPDIREAVADNANTPMDTLMLLSQDESSNVRYAMAENHNLPKAILCALSNDENPLVAERAARTMKRVEREYSQVLHTHGLDEGQAFQLRKTLIRNALPQ